MNNKKLSRNKKIFNYIKNVFRLFLMFVFFVCALGLIFNYDMFAVCFLFCFILLIPNFANYIYKEFRVNKIIKYLIIVVMFFIGVFCSKPIDMHNNYDNIDKNIIIENDKAEEDKSSNYKEKTKKKSSKKKKDSKILKINSKEYFELVNNAFVSATENNEYWYYSDAHQHYPYIQVSIKPKKEMSKDVMAVQAIAVCNKLVDILKKYEYKSGGLFAYNYDMINIYFYYYMYGGLSRNGGPFIQFSIYDVGNLNVNNIL